MSKPSGSEEAAAGTEQTAVLEARNVYRFRTVDQKQVPIVRDVSFRLGRSGANCCIHLPNQRLHWRYF